MAHKQRYPALPGNIQYAFRSRHALRGRHGGGCTAARRRKLYVCQISLKITIFKRRDLRKHPEIPQRTQPVPGHLGGVQGPLH